MSAFKWLRAVLLESLIYFFRQRVLYIGNLPNVERHRPAVATLLVCLQGDCRMRSAEMGIDETRKSALLPAHFAREMRHGNRPVAMLWLEPGGDDYEALLHLMTRQAQGYGFAMKNESRAIAMLRDIHANQPSAAACRRQLDALLKPSRPRGPKSRPLDRRIRHALETMRRDPSQKHALEILSREVFLSPTRFTHLFKDEIGAPMRRYRMWLRFRKTLQRVAGGEIMTNAAREAGFTDSAHFSRAFRAMFGMRPSAIMKRKRSPKAFIATDNGR